MKEFICEYQHFFGVLLVIATILLVIAMFWAGTWLSDLIGEINSSKEEGKTAVKRITSGIMFILDKIWLLVVSSFCVMPIILFAYMMIYAATEWVDYWGMTVLLGLIMGVEWSFLASNLSSWRRGNSIKVEGKWNNKIKDIITSERFGVIFGSICFGPLLITFIVMCGLGIWKMLSVLYGWYVLQICGI